MFPTFILFQVKKIISTYNGNVPLSVYLSAYYKKHTNAGSKDRKLISSLVYSWYRCSKAIDINLVPTFEGQIELCYSIVYRKNLDVEHSNNKFHTEKLFPHKILLSTGINKDEWLVSMKLQPNLFLRIRNNREEIFSILSKHNIEINIISDNCISLPNGTKIDTLIPQSYYVVQDASSQKTAKFFNPIKGERWYDCCCGAGGKSLILSDLEKSISLTVTDIRTSIIHNLEKRFEIYGIKLPISKVVDASDNLQLKNTLKNTKFDNIICDVPCTGSGTWARTPEQMYFFNPQKLNTISVLQERIAANVSEFLKPGGRLIYITCSVFKHENEEVVNRLLANTQLILQEQELINGIENNADSMFVAVFKKV